MSSELIMTVADYAEKNKKQYDEIEAIFGEVPISIMYKIIQNKRLFNVYKRSECKKFLNILEAIDQLRDDSILIFIGELQLYGLFEPSDYLHFTKYLGEMFEEDNIQSTPYQIVLNNYRQKIVFMYARPEANIESVDLISKISIYVKEFFAASVITTENHDNIEITINKILDGSREDNFERLLEFISKKDRLLADKISLLRMVRNREYRYSMPKLNKNISDMSDLLAILKTSPNIMINNLIINNGNIIGDVVQQVNTKKTTAAEWIKNNLPQDHEITTDYYARYELANKNPIYNNQFGKLVRDLGYKIVNGTKCRYWSL